MTIKQAIIIKKTIENVLMGAAAVVIIGTTSKVVYDTEFREDPETLIGFEQYVPQGYQIRSIALPTKGDVIEVKVLDSPELPYIVEQQGNELVVKGFFYYKIRPDRHFAPNNENQSDILGRTPSNNDYWGDIRVGTITFTRQQKEE